MKSSIAMQELLEIMNYLRDPLTGCDWVKKQTFASIAPFTLEETYEVIDAIENGTPANVQNELGDLLLQILFYCQIAKENQWFDFEKVANALKEKLIRRHPHIFSPHTLSDDSLLLAQSKPHELWEIIKAQEKSEEEQLETFEKKQKAKKAVLLSTIPNNLPGLLRAQKLQTRAAKVGFDWPNIQLVLTKLKEEIKEFEEAQQTNSLDHAKEELGDILFVCANLARHLKSDAEAIMRQANHKFERRFNAVEQSVVNSGKAWEWFSLDELEAFWDLAKKNEKHE